MKINIVYNKLIPDFESALSVIESTLINNKVEFKSFELDKMEHFGDFTFVIGGDGTLLKTARFYNVPVLGINLGRLGFLSQARATEINTVLENVLDSKFKTEERLMLESEQCLALNDFVIKGCSHSRTSKLYLEINGKFVCDYIADGLIISTPTGSTAYGLSAGGPIISPNLNVFVIVPICPHTLTARPIVVPDSEIITISSSKDLTNYFASTDGQEFYEFKKEIEIKKSENTACLALLDDSEFYTILRSKLHWGTSPACI